MHQGQSIGNQYTSYNRCSYLCFVAFETHFQEQVKQVKTNDEIYFSLLRVESHRRPESNPNKQVWQMYNKIEPMFGGNRIIYHIYIYAYVVSCLACYVS